MEEVIAISTHLEHDFLTSLCESNQPVSIFLVNGIRLQGVISKFDNETILLESASKQIIYKHAVSTILSGSE